MDFGGEVADDDDAAKAAERLERALDRIATLISASPPVEPDAQGEMTETVAEVARRLDIMIGRIRSALGSRASE